MKTELDKKLYLILGILLLILIIVIVVYPIYSNEVSMYSHISEITNYNNYMKELTYEERCDELNKAVKYNKELTEEISGGMTYSYEDVLDFNEVMGYISIPKIDVEIPIYHGDSDEILEKGVGHMKGTTLPIGRKGTHSVLAGHSGLDKCKIFDDIDKLEIGDEFYIYILGEKHIYKVDNIDIVLPEETDFIKIEGLKNYITLVTCTPKKVNTHRLLVRGIRIDE